MAEKQRQGREHTGHGGSVRALVCVNLNTPHGSAPSQAPPVQQQHDALLIACDGSASSGAGTVPSVTSAFLLTKYTHARVVRLTAFSPATTPAAA